MPNTRNWNNVVEIFVIKHITAEDREGRTIHTDGDDKSLFCTE